MISQTQAAPVKKIREIPPTPLDDINSKRYHQLRTAAYCRVSTDSDEQELSFSSQVEFYTDKIMRNPEWCLAGIFADEGISGTQAYKRKKFMKMIQQCRQGKIDQIITKSVSRFARNTVDCLLYVRELKKLGIPVIFEKEGINTMHMSSEIYISMHGIFAQSESESLSGNVRWGKEKSAKKGNVTMHYANFLGYRRGTDNQPEIVPEEAQTIQYIYNNFLAGDSLEIIKNNLEIQNILSPSGKEKWSKQTIYSILTNEKYKGDALLQKTYVVDCITHKTKRNTDRTKYYVKNNHPAIIREEIFARVQEEIAMRASKHKTKEVGTKTDLGKYSSKYALTDLLICGKCGTPYRRVTWSKNGKKKIVWRCINRLDYGKKYCSDSPTIEESVIHDAVVKAISEIVNDSENQIAIYNLQLHIKMFYEQADDNSIYQDELSLNQLKDEILKKANLMTDDNELQYTEDIQILSQEISIIKKRIEEKNTKQIAHGINQPKLNEVLNSLDSLKNKPINYDDRTVRQLIECIKVTSKQELLVVFKGGIEKNILI